MTVYEEKTVAYAQTVLLVDSPAANAVLYLVIFSSSESPAR